MELFPIYEENIEISPKIWYSLSGIGESPMMRVGHTLIHLNFAKNNENEEEKGKLFLIGGANPSGSFNDVYIFDMNKLNWDKLVDLENFEIGRYEHSCFFSDKDRHVYIFGGASENGNLNEILQFDFESENICKKMNNESTNKPSARTIHGGVVYKNQLLIFGGGLSGNQPVDDEKVYIYNPSTDKWISLNIQGESPQQRHGHLMLNFQDEMIFLHGGMNLEHIYDDLWCLNLKTIKWQRVNYDTNKPYPQPRAAHGGITINKNIYIFGGLSKSGQALDDLWKYNTESNDWSLIDIWEFRPPPRLDFAYTKMKFISKRVKADTEGNNEIQDQNVNSEQKEMREFLVIHGGMDTEGNVFDDMFMINLD